MRLWLIPMIYVGASVVCGLALPRIEQAYLSSYTMNLSVAAYATRLHKTLKAGKGRCERFQIRQINSGETSKPTHLPSGYVKHSRRNVELGGLHRSR